MLIFPSFNEAHFPKSIVRDNNKKQLNLVQIETNYLLAKKYLLYNVTAQQYAAIFVPIGIHVSGYQMSFQWKY